MLLRLPTPSLEQLNYHIHSDAAPDDYWDYLQITISNLHGFIVQMCGTRWGRLDENHIMFHYRGDRMLSITHCDFKRLRKFPFASEAMREYVDRMNRIHSNLQWTNSTNILKYAYSYFKQINFFMINWDDFEQNIPTFEAPYLRHFTYTPQHETDRIVGCVKNNSTSDIGEHGSRHSAPKQSFDASWVGREGYEHLSNHTTIYSLLQREYPLNIHYPFTEKLKQFLEGIDELRLMKIDVGVD